MSIRIGVLVAACVFAPAPWTAQAEDKQASLACDTPLQSAPRAVKETLGPLYRIAGSPEQLSAASNALKELVDAATFCRISAQSPSTESPRELAGEWYSLHQWLSRLADFLYLNSRGRGRVDWKIEYEAFATVYEFET